MLTQRLEGGRVEGEGASPAGRLGVGLVHLVVDGHPGQSRRQPGPGEVDVAPAEAGQLGPTHASRGHQDPERVQPVVAHVSEEGAQLLRAPDLPLRRCAMRWVDVIGPVVGHIAPAGRIFQRPVEQRMDVADGLGRQALAVASPVGEELAVEGRDAGRGEPLQLQGTRAGLMWTCRLVW
jgi:hypothetical protein